MSVDFSVSSCLARWRNYIQYPDSALSFSETHANTLKNILKKAFRDLSQVKNCTRQKKSFDRKAIGCICECADLLERIINCIKSLLPKKNDSASQDLADLKAIDQSIPILNTQELRADRAIQYLRSLPQNMSALDALVGTQGLLTLPIFTRILKIYTASGLNRCLIHAGLQTVGNLITLFENEKKQPAIQVLKDHLDKNRETALAAMTLDERRRFNEQWDPSPKRACVFLSKIIPIEPPEKMDAWDFLRSIQYEEELLNGSTRGEGILQDIQLYQGEEGDYYLKTILYKDSKGETVFGASHKKLSIGPNYLWSPDGKNFHLLECKSSNGNAQTYRASFETEKGSQSPITQVTLRVNAVYAQLFNYKQQLLTHYERLGLEKVKEITSRFRTRGAQILPLPLAPQQIHLFKMVKQGEYEYLYVDSGAEYLEDRLVVISNFSCSLPNERERV